MKPAQPAPPAPPSATVVFGTGLAGAAQYAGLLAGPGVVRGVIGPRETERLWDRHLTACAVLGELIPDGASVLDIGSGAGLPGVPLALARPDLRVTLLEPMSRRVTWLTEIVEELGIEVSVHRGRAEDAALRARLGQFDVVTSRAVAPLGRLAGWCLPWAHPGGRMLALKGSSAADEIERDSVDIGSAGGGGARVLNCGADSLDPPTTVVEIVRSVATARPRSGSSRRPSGRRAVSARSQTRTRKDR